MQINMRCYGDKPPEFLRKASQQRACTPMGLLGMLLPCWLPAAEADLIVGCAPLACHITRPILTATLHAGALWPAAGAGGGRPGHH